MRAHFAAGQVSAGALRLAFGKTPSSYFRAVDPLSDRITVQRAQDIARRLLAHAIDGFARDAGDMRRRDHVGQAEQGIVH